MRQSRHRPCSMGWGRSTHQTGVGHPQFGPSRRLFHGKARAVGHLLGRQPDCRSGLRLENGGRFPAHPLGYHSSHPFDRPDPQLRCRPESRFAARGCLPQPSDRRRPPQIRPPQIRPLKNRLSVLWDLWMAGCGYRSPNRGVPPNQEARTGCCFHGEWSRTPVRPKETWRR